MAAVYKGIMKFVKNNSFADEDEIRFYFETESISETIRIIYSTGEDRADETDIEFEQNFCNLVRLLQISQEHYMLSQAGIGSYHNRRPTQKIARRDMRPPWCDHTWGTMFLEQCMQSAVRFCGLVNCKTTTSMNR